MNVMFMRQFDVYVMSLNLNGHKDGNDLCRFTYHYALTPIPLGRS
jgi:hypothetical protein